MKTQISRRNFLKAAASGAALATSAGLGIVPAFAEDETTSTATATSSDSSTYRYVSDYGTDIYDEDRLQQLEDDCAAWSETEVEQGCVLLRNENAALPLTEGDRITLFGQSSVESTIEVEQDTSFGGTKKYSGPFYTYHSGGDASAGAMVPTVTYLSVMQESFEVNPTLVEAYQSSGVFRVKSTEEPEIGEAPASLYTEDVKASWASDYNDAAVIMLTRQASEDCDLVLEDGEGISQLALHQNERDLLQMVKDAKDAGTFKKVVVLVNSSWAIELGDLPDYGVDAILWVGGPGATGFRGVRNVLIGKVSPSGKMIVTYAKNSLSAPAITYAQLKNTPTWANLDEVLAGTQITDKFVSYYLIYAENIYVGYKYYETRYEDCVLGQGSADAKVGSSTGAAWNYSDEVAYPFGYGLSYTTFEQKLDQVSYDSESDEYTVAVTVTNTGDVAGRSVVEVYAQTPYGDYERENLVEKSAVQLVGFGKTAELEPGASETVEVTVERYLLASYDYTKAKTWILSEGGYYLAIGDDCHDALNNILAAKGATGMVAVTGEDAVGDVEKVYSWDESALDMTTYAKSRYSGVEVTNSFDDTNLNNMGIETVTYLSRQDWEGTYPVEQIALNASEAMIFDLNGDIYEKPDDAPAVSDFTQGVDSGLTFADMQDVEYDDDETWETFLNQLTVEEMASILPDQNGSAAIESIAMPASYRGDDMDCLEQVHFKLNDKSGINWPVIQLSVATWDKSEIETRAKYTANEAYFMGCNEIWSGGPNIRRTPFNGRASAYYSEDGMMGYYIGQVQTKACAKYGIILGLKHLTLNDQEACRESVATFCNEQAIRENYLRAFEGAYAKAGCSGLMMAFNRMGTTYCGSAKELYDVLREEWGCLVNVCSDACVGSDYKTQYASDLAAGMTFWCWDMAGFGADSGEAVVSDTKVAQMVNDGDGYILQLLREATKIHVYTESRSIMVNGLAAGATIVHTTPWWENALTGAEVASGAIGAAALGLYAAKAFAWDGKAEKGGE